MRQDSEYMYCVRGRGVVVRFWRMRESLTSRPALGLAKHINPLNAELNPIYYLMALLGAYHIPHVSRIRVKANIEIPWHLTRLILTL